MNDTALPFGPLTVDHGVELPERSVPTGAGRTSEYEGYRDSLEQLPVGDGFFVAGKTLKETNGLFNFAKSIGVQTARGHTSNDTVYQKAGVRFVRISDAAAAARKRKPKTEVAAAVTGPNGEGAAPAGAPADEDNEL